MTERIINLLLLAIFIAGIGVVFIPLILLRVTDDFPGRAFYSVLFMAAAAEKMYAMFFRTRSLACLKAKRDWTTVSVGIAYTAVYYATLFEFYFWHPGISFMFVSIAGFAVYFSAVMFRYWAFHHLGQQWSVHLDRGPSAERNLITTGPYRWVRHPLYAGAIFEAISFPLIFNSVLGLIIGLFFFVPLEVHRAYFEERFLRATFNDQYSSYRQSTWGFFPLPWRKKMPRSDFL